MGTQGKIYSRNWKFGFWKSRKPTKINCDKFILFILSYCLNKSIFLVAIIEYNFSIELNQLLNWIVLIGQINSSRQVQCADDLCVVVGPVDVWL